MKTRSGNSFHTLISNTNRKIVHDVVFKKKTFVRPNLTPKFTGVNCRPRRQFIGNTEQGRKWSSRSSPGKDQLFGDNDKGHYSLLHSLRKRCAKDNLLYKMTLTATVFITFSIAFGIALAFLVQASFHHHCSNEVLLPLSIKPEVIKILPSCNESMWMYREEHQKELKHEIVQLESLLEDSWRQCFKFNYDAAEAYQCKRENDEHLEKIKQLEVKGRDLEEEISTQRELFGERLSLKQQQLDKLAKAIATFRQDHVCVNEYFMYKCVVVGIIFSVAVGFFILCFYKYFKQMTMFI